MYSSTISLTSALDWIGGRKRHASAALPPGKHGTHCTGGWVSPRSDLDGRKISPLRGFYPRTVQPVASRFTD